VSKNGTFFEAKPMPLICHSCTWHCEVVSYVLGLFLLVPELSTSIA
jgi:hypothetical protein